MQRVATVVGAFDGVVLRSILAASLEQAAARAESYCRHFVEAQNCNRESGNRVAITLDVYIPVKGGEKVGEEWSTIHDCWVEVAARSAGFVLYQFRYKPGTFEEYVFKRVPEFQEVLGL
jgi:hypothetical protein